MILLAILISIILFGGIFLLCDDRKEVIQLFRTEKKLITLIFLPVFIFFGYPAFLYTAVTPAENLLWNVYNFCGMPTYALPKGSFYKWWNLVYVGTDAIKRIFFYFPVGGLFLIGLVWYNLKHKYSTVAYISLLIVEVIVLFITFSY